MRWIDPNGELAKDLQKYEVSGIVLKKFNDGGSQLAQINDEQGSVKVLQFLFDNI